MARINIEDSIFKDRRYLKLLMHTQCEFKTLGLITSAWILAQDNWLKYKSIPKKAWPKELDILINFELAERLEDGNVYVKGSERAFSWLEQKQAAGKKVSEKKLEQLKSARDKKISKNEEKTLNGSERTLNETERTLNGSEALTLSLSHTLSLNKTNTLNTLCTDVQESRCDNKSLSLVQKSTSLNKKTFKVSSFQDFDWILPSQNKTNLGLLYPDYEFLRREFLKMTNWLIANPKKNLKTSRSWSQFVSHWLDKAWPKYQQSYDSNKSQVDVSDRIKDLFANSSEVGL